MNSQGNATLPEGDGAVCPGRSEDGRRHVAGLRAFDIALKWGRSTRELPESGGVGSWLEADDSS